MYKSRLQELCQRRSWNLPDYSTIRDGPDHVPRFKAVAVVNGLNFETPDQCKSAKEAQNLVAKVAYEYFTAQSPSAVSQPVFPTCPSSPAGRVPEMQAVPVPVPVPVSPLPASLPLPTGLLAPNNSALSEPVPKDMLQPNFGGTHHMYKNRLQQYAQKRDLSLPVYSCEFEGPPHSRRFKSRVSFDGKSFETMEFFPTLKEAEHAAAMFACQMLHIDPSQENGGLHKNLLQELAQKRGLLYPTYETVKSGPPHRSIFVSTVQIESRIFRGEEAKNKKQAEMNAATVAYRALTESSVMTECSKASSIMECVVSDNFTQSSLPAETMKRGEFLANEETEICAKRIKSSPQNETANLSALLPPEVSSAQVEHQLVSQPVSGQHEDQCYKTVVFPRNSNFPIPDGAVVMPCSDDQWVAYKVELNQEPAA